MKRSTGLAPLLVGLLMSSSARGQSASLKSEESVRELCLGLRPVERVTFPGDPARRAVARADYEKQRERLRQTEYELELRWGEFTVAEWDPDQKVATVSTERPFRALGGALVLFDPDREEIELEALEGSAEALQAALAKGQATLRLTFKPAEEEGSPCVVGKVRTYALSVDLLSAELRADGRALARANGAGFEARSPGSGTPNVELKAAPALDCAGCREEVVASAMKSRPLIEKCYQDALAQKPGLDGSLMLELEVAPDGKLGVSSVVVDTLQDSDAVACVKQAVATARSASRGGKGMLHARFELR